ncbi:hypothetical protein ACP275_02G076800 [Erythranthe tilingii]
MAAARAIGNRILKSDRASVNYSRFFSSSRFDYQSIDRPSNNLEMQYNSEKLTNGLVKEVQRLQHEIQDLRCQVDEVIAHQRSEIQTRRESELESEKFARIKLCIVFVGCLSITGLAAYQVYMIY